MKRIILSILISVFISVIIPLIVVELLKPDSNADSTQPLPSPTVSGDMQV